MHVRKQICLFEQWRMMNVDTVIFVGRLYRFTPIWVFDGRKISQNPMYVCSFLHFFILSFVDLELFGKFFPLQMNFDFIGYIIIFVA